MMTIFRNMVNHCIRIGLENNITTLKKLSLLSYNQLKDYKIPSYYKVNAISQACGRLAQRKRSIRKGIRTKSPFVRRKYLISNFGFKINGVLVSIPADKGIPIIFVDPKRTSKLCPICGERIQEDRLNRRKVLCSNCGRSMDRDVIASMNIAHKGWSRFCHPRGLPEEAMKRNLDNLKPVILRVDGSKLTEVKSSRLVEPISIKQD